jgi:uncharacterized delta-60 repeat protein
VPRLVLIAVSAVVAAGVSGGIEARSSSPPHEFGSSGAAVIEYDGKIVAVPRWRGYGKGGFETARYRRDGRLDPRFGDDGRAVANFDSRYGSGAAAVAVQANHKIVAFGWSLLYQPDPAQCREGGQFAIARYLPSGRLDRRFGKGGRVLMKFGDTDGLIAGAVQPNGRIIAVGSRWCHISSILQLARYTRDGRLDRSFGKRGKVVNGRLSPNAVAMQSDGKIVLAGFVLPDPAQAPQAALVRYLANGRLDRGFGTRGTVVTRLDGGGGFADVAVQPDGKILAAGGVGPGRFVLARYEPDGRPDSSFGDGGKVVTAFGPSDDDASAAAIQADGKIVIGGFHMIGTADNAPRVLALVRYTPDGRLDPSFGRGGKVVKKNRGGAAGIAIQHDGRIVVLALQSPRQTSFALVLLRFMPDGSPETGFGK